jgi:hypothetical protein
MRRPKTSAESGIDRIGDGPVLLQRVPRAYGRTAVEHRGAGDSDLLEARLKVADLGFIPFRGHVPSAAGFDGRENSQDTSQSGFRRVRNGFVLGRFQAPLDAFVGQ